VYEAINEKRVERAENIISPGLVQRKVRWGHGGFLRSEVFFQNLSRKRNISEPLERSRKKGRAFRRIQRKTMRSVGGRSGRETAYPNEKGNPCSRGRGFCREKNMYRREVTSIVLCMCVSAVRKGGPEKERGGGSWRLGGNENEKGADRRGKRPCTQKEQFAPRDRTERRSDRNKGGKITPRCLTDRLIRKTEGFPFRLEKR